MDYKDYPVLSDAELPNVSVITPCLGRQHFLPLCVANLFHFDYPKEKITWCLYQDGDQGSMFESKEHEQYIRDKLHPIKLIYKYDPKNKKTIGEKRNFCIKKMNTNKFVAMMDSDDIYLPTYLRYALSTIKIKKMGIVGSKSMLFVYPYKDYKMTAIRCEHKRQIHEGTSVLSMKHFNSTSGFSKSSQGEGTGLLDYCESRAYDLDITLIMVCVDHGFNTIPKDFFDKDNNKIDATIGGLHYKILDAILRDKYPDKFSKTTQQASSLSQEQLESPPQQPPE